MQLAFLAPAPSRWKNYTTREQIPDVTCITEVPPKTPLNGAGKLKWNINFCYRNNNLRGNRWSALRAGIGRVKGYLVRCRKLCAIRRHHPGQPLKPKS